MEAALHAADKAAAATAVKTAAATTKAAGALEHPGPVPPSEHVDVISSFLLNVTPTSPRTRPLPEDFIQQLDPPSQEARLRLPKGNQPAGSTSTPQRARPRRLASGGRGAPKRLMSLVQV